MSLDAENLKILLAAIEAALEALNRILNLLELQPSSEDLDRNLDFYEAVRNFEISNARFDQPAGPGENQTRSRGSLYYGL